MGTLILDPFAIFGDDGFSPEAQLVIDRMTGLTGVEKNAIAVFVDAEVLNGNWGLLDEFWCFKLVAEANALTGWFAKIATNNGSTKVSEGFSYDGASNYINSNFNLFTDGSNYTQNDAMIETFIFEYTNINTNRFIFGAREGLNATYVFEGAIGTHFYRVNSSSNPSISGGFPDNTLFTYVREVSNQIKSYQNGTIFGTNGNTSVTPPNFNVIIAGSDRDGNISGFSKHISSSFAIGAGIGFNHSEHYTNLTTLLNAL